MDTVHVCVELDVKAPSYQGNKSREVMNDVDRKIVLVHPFDSHKVDIRDGEYAIIVPLAPLNGRCPCDINPESIFSAICKVRISTSPSHSNTSIMRTRKAAATTTISEGETQLLSWWLSDNLTSADPPSTPLERRSLVSSPAISKIMSPGAANTSPHKSKFSFAQGGGGDILTSFTHKTSSQFSSAKNDDIDIESPCRSRSLQRRCLLIPLNNLSNQQLIGLCSDAVELVLCPVNGSNKYTDQPASKNHYEGSLAASHNVIQTLIVAKYHGSYVNAPNLFNKSQPLNPLDHSTPDCLEALSIALRGQIESFYIVNVIPGERTIQTSNADQSHLCLAVDRLNMSSNSISAMHDLVNDANDTVKKSEALAGNFLKRERIVAYRITHQTRMHFVSSLAQSVTIENNTSSTPVNEPNLCAGLDATLSRMRDVLLPAILHPNLFPADGPLRPPKGALLHGPAGVGKSLIAAQFAQDLTTGLYSNKNSRIHVRTLQCADLLASTAFVGEAENILTGVFEEAEREAFGSKGALVILDDIHLVCPRRGGAGSGSGGLGLEQLTGTLLALLDGIGGSHPHGSRTLKLRKGGFVVLAITSDPSLLDPALRRSGRLDAEIEVLVPDDKTREEIFRFQIGKFVPRRLCNNNLYDGSDESDISGNALESLARLAKGFTGADCKLAVKEAIRYSMIRKHESKNSPQKNNRSIDCDDFHCISIEVVDLEHAIRATKPSAIKSIAVEVPHVPWSAIGGMDSVKALLRESIELPLTHPHLFEMMKVPPPKGILLYGPPGCSKTLMARAIATEGKMNFLAVKGPELLSKWLGESERALASLFRRARLASPAVVFFDELDAIAAKRGEGSGGGDRLLSQLLTELDGVTCGTDDATCKKRSRVVVVGATNRPDVLDPALTRPGRMDRMIYVGLPDEEGRERIFEIGLKEKACQLDVDMAILASDAISKGYSGAEIIAICRDAALHAIGDMDNGTFNTPQISMKHLIRSINDTKPRTTDQMLQFYESFRGRH